MAAGPACNQGPASSLGVGGGAAAASEQAQRCPPPVLHVRADAAVVESVAEHKERHQTYDPKCARCIWSKHGAAWQRSIAVPDPRTGALTVPIVAAPDHRPAPFAIGCVFCAQFRVQGSTKGTAEAGRAKAFASFTVAQPSMLQKSHLANHCQTRFHMAAEAAFFGGSVDGFQPEDEPLEGVTTCSPEVGQTVPRADRIVGALQIVGGSESHRQYTRICAASDLTNPLSVVGNEVDASRQTCKKIIRCAGSVCRDKHQALLRRAHRLAFAYDDRDQVNVLRVRVVCCEPKVEAAEFVADVAEDYGFTEAAHADVVWGGLRRLRVLEKGKRDASMASGPEDCVDEALLARMQQITFAGASDGAGVAIGGIQELRRSGRLPNLRYQFRDRPHTTRTCMKCTWKHMAGGQEVLDALVSGPHSFAKRVRYSRRVRQVWKDTQRENPDDFMVVLEHLSHAEQRYDSRSEPMSILCGKMGSVIRVLVTLAADPAPSHKDDRIFARDLLKKLQGREGFERLVVFGLDADFAVATCALTRLQDTSSADVALSASQVVYCLEVCEALFRDGGALQLKPNGTYTSSLLHSIRASPEATGGLQPGHANRIGWPEGAPILEKPAAYAQSLYLLVKHFFQLNWPDHAWRTKFSAFHCGAGKYPEELRLAYVEELAKKEGLDPAQARLQFQRLLPHTERLMKHHGDNRLVWAELCESLRVSGKRKFRPDAHCILPLCLTYLGILDGTGDVERAFAGVQMRELKHRQRHLGRQGLADELMVRMEFPKELDALVTRTPEPLQALSADPAVARQMQVMWRPRQLILQVPVACGREQQLWFVLKYRTTSIPQRT